LEIPAMPIDRSEELPASRREFVRRLGATAAAIGFGGLDAERAAAAEVIVPADRLARVGVQLYTVRTEMQKGVERTLEQIARIGYKEVEFAGYFDRPAKEIKALLDRVGLAAPAAHSADLNAIRGNFAKALEDATTIGHRWVVCAWLPDDARSVDGYKKAAAEFNRAGELARKAGVRFAYHNHDFEFKSLGNTTGFDVLLAETDPKLVEFELDLFWITKGKHDPLEYFAKHAGRFPLVHVKDMTASGDMTDVGAGSIPWAKLFAKRKQAGIQHFFVEHDQPKAPFESVGASYRYLSRLEF
jgi:sugar phosphate isomerase/epimerase